MCVVLLQIVIVVKNQGKMEVGMIEPAKINYKSIDGVMDEQTVDLHYGKHLKAYADNLNGLLNGTPFQDWTLEELVQRFDEVDLPTRQGIINNGGGVHNHNLFFAQYSLTPKSAPTGELLEKINEDFGSLSELKERLLETGLKQFGSGWSFLVVDKDGNLKVEGRPNQDNPEMLDKEPILLGLDVWEHAYYLMYQNLRIKYLEQAIDKLDWDVIESRYSQAKNR